MTQELNLLRHCWMTLEALIAHMDSVNNLNSGIIEQMTQLYLNKLLSTSSGWASHLHLLLMPQNTGHFVHLPYGTGKKKKNYTIHIHRIYKNIQKNLPQFKKCFNAGKCFSTHKTLWGSLLKIWIMTFGSQNCLWRQT